jgi:hypothetical protein
VPDSLHPPAAPSFPPGALTPQKPSQPHSRNWSRGVIRKAATSGTALAPLPLKAVSPREREICTSRA